MMDHLLDFLEDAVLRSNDDDGYNENNENDDHNSQFFPHHHHRQQHHRHHQPHHNDGGRRLRRRSSEEHRGNASHDTTTNGANDNNNRRIIMDPELLERVQGVFYCEEEDSLTAMASFLMQHPETLTMTDRHDNTLLHMACGHDADMNVIYYLTELLPDAAQAPNAWHQTPAHHLDFELARPEYQDDENDDDERTNAMETLRYLVRRYPQILGMCDDLCNRTPLHDVCFHRGRDRNDVDVIYREFMTLWPSACLLHDSNTKFPISLVNDSLGDDDVDIVWEKPEDPAYVNVRTVTWEAAFALVDAALMNKSGLPPAVVDHVLKCGDPDDDPSSSWGLYYRPGNALKAPFSPRDFYALLVQRDVQSALRQERYQRLLHGFVHMNRAGREYVVRRPTNKARGVQVLSAVTESLDCLFIHLRENPLLCGPDDDSSTTTDDD